MQGTERMTIGGILAVLGLLSATARPADTLDDTFDLTRLPFEQLLQTEIITAAKMARQVSDAPSAVAIVTAQDIRDYGYRTLADILNSMRGLYTTYDRSYQYLGGRGFGRPGDFTGRILVMIDGYATNDNIYNQAYIDNAGIVDTELIERVEYVPGTGSVLYGNNAYFGIINIITKKGRQFGGVQVAGELFSQEGKKGRLTYGKQLENGADILVSTSWLDSHGQDLYFPEFDNPATDSNFSLNQGMARNLDYEGARRWFAKLHYEGLTLETGIADRKKGIPTAAYGVAFNTYNQYWDENGFFNANYDTDLGQSLKSSTRAYYGSYLDHGVNDNPNGQWREHNRGEWWGIDERLVATWFDRHQWVLGMEYRNDFRRTLANPVNFSNPARTTVSLYVQDEIRLNDQLRLNVGGRYDKGSDVDGNLSPRIALLYAPLPQTAIKASYSTAFRMPAAYEKYYTDGVQLPNPNLGSEYITTTELVLEQRFSPTLRFTGSAYHYHTHDLITQVALAPDGNHFANTGSNRAKGVELELERLWDHGVRLRTSLAWENAVSENGRRMINSPENLGKLNLAFPWFHNRMRTGLELQYVGSRLTENQDRLGSYTLANLTFTADHFLRGLSLSASVRNLFDRRYAAVAPSGFVQDALQMDGRTVWLQLQYDFR
ncbi:iron complex outermembrane recepter protein [Gammaproteobacteria bacterium]